MPLFLKACFIFNIAIAISYLITRGLCLLPVLRHAMSNCQRLKFSRHAFLVSMIAIIIMPVIIHFATPFLENTDFYLAPILKTSQDVFLQNLSPVYLSAYHVIQHVIQYDFYYFYNLSVFYIIFIALLLFFAGSVFYILKYFKAIFDLQKIKQHAFCQHKINNVHVLFSQTACKPFCWSWFLQHFIIVPACYLEKPDCLKLAVRHELQHIRQGDTYWLQLLMALKIFCYWNPFMLLWSKWFCELQEFSCDEAVVLRKKTSPLGYAQCLMDAAKDALIHASPPTGALGIHNLSQSVLYRRIHMLFDYKTRSTRKPRKLLILSAYAGMLLTAISTAWALNNPATRQPLSEAELNHIIQQSHFDPAFHITATPELLSEINHIRSSDQARKFMQDSLARMQKYQPVIQADLKKNSLPDELLAVPLVESGYQPLTSDKNPVQAAGIWQMIPNTAQHFGLVVNAHQDDRLNTALETKAALAYLTVLHQQFDHNWKTSVIAYEYGEQQTAQLIKTSGNAPKNLANFVAMFDATAVIIKDPALVA